MMTFQRKTRMFVGALALSVTATGWSAERRVESETTFMAEYQTGSDIDFWSVGLGVQPNDQPGSFGGIFYSKMTLNDEQSFEGTSLGERETTIDSFGVRGFSVSGTGDSPYGADMRIALSETKTQGYSRTGVEIGANFYGPLSGRLTWFCGATLRPEFLSFDWNSDVITEIGVNVGVDYRPIPGVGLFAKYYYENMLTDDLDSWNLGSGALIGLNLVF
ncbi:hypothetical protein [Marinomonas mediterranea]|uniref:hypothetical protein n=1 Tax=Marinomonas mediterranea TaxID=119864 RepID=UPI00234BE03C|nr:hypothetical protein [Marinomonas mediterranea]WCN08592.1 hypothetical protein GV055_06440 [Marinomonas mediterranea]WCN12646.1 hypothetical protein GV054_06280 [Marinomonas mediterranea]